METTAMGNYSGMIKSLASRHHFPYSYLSEQWNDVEAWQKAAREELTKLLSYDPEPLPLDAVVHWTRVEDGLVHELVSYAQHYGPRTEGIFIYPEGSRGKLPTIMALHDHGGFKYFGKEKLVKLAGEHPCLQEYRDNLYGGQAWASEIAKRGYAVFVPDIFLWGSRRLTVDCLPQRLTTKIRSVISAGKGEKPGEHPHAEYVRAYNDLANDYECIVAKSLILSGATWTGAMAYEDRRAMDYLVTRPEVDLDRIGCGGLSCGGLRTVYLTALDDRIQCSVCVGYMDTMYEEAVYMAYQNTWMFHLPGLVYLMDFPDVYSLHGKKPTMLQFDIDDFLWTDKGQRDSDRRMRQIFEKMGVPEMYSGKFYEGTHKFDVEMQKDAFAFYDKWL